MDGSRSFHSAALWGGDHTQLGDVATARIDAKTAIALSRGKYPKGYPHLDPNEDAVLAATWESTTLLAVADGHRGFDAAQAALGGVESSTRQLLDGGDEADSAIREALESARRAVEHALAASDVARSGSRTTLAIALLVHDTVSIGGLGDSRIAIVRPGASRSFWGPAPFLGPDTSIDEGWFFTTGIEAGDWVIAATDGLFDFLGRNWQAQLEALADAETPAVLATRAVEIAFAGGAGDNVAVAVARV